SPHLRSAGLRSANAAISLSPTLMDVSVADTSASRRPRMESYFSRWARTLLSLRSLTATTSMSAPEAWTARKKLRPMRPKPLIPTRTVTVTPDWRWSNSSPTLSRHESTPTAAIGNGPATGDEDQRGSLLVGEHLRSQGGLGVGNTHLLGPLVRHGQQAP